MCCMQVEFYRHADPTCVQAALAMESAIFMGCVCALVDVVVQQHAAGQVQDAHTLPHHSQHLRRAHNIA